jgi:hypothetical protein
VELSSVRTHHKSRSVYKAARDGVTIAVRFAAFSVSADVLAPSMQACRETQSAATDDNRAPGAILEALLTDFSRTGLSYSSKRSLAKHFGRQRCDPYCPSRGERRVHSGALSAGWPATARIIVASLL